MPAAGFIYDFCGEHMVVINKEPLDICLNEESDLVFCDSLGTIFTEIGKNI